MGDAINESQPAGQRRMTAILVAIAAVVYIAVGVYSVFNGRTWTDEASYLIKSWWYVQGVVEPYSDQDATWYMPLFFYELGAIQAVFGAGIVAGRLAALVIGGLSGVLLFFICRRLTDNTMVSALALLLYLGTPTTAFYFSTATPLSSVALLHLAAIWLVLASANRPRASTSIALGVLFCALYFYRQNMVLAILWLAPVYIYVIGRDRWRHAAIATTATAITTAAILAMFPAKLAFYAVRLPGVVPILQWLDLLPENQSLLLEGTETPLNLDIKLSYAATTDVWNAFLLPYFGTTALAFALFFMAKRSMRPFIIVSAYFFFLVLTHYVGSLSYCRTCIQTYVNYFYGAGAIAAALSLVAVWRMCLAAKRPAVPIVTALGMCAALLNIFAGGLAISNDPLIKDAFRFFPEPMLRKFQHESELVEIEGFANVLAAAIPANSKVLVLHDQPSLVYAVFRAGSHVVPQSLNIRQSYRQIRDEWPEANRAALISALEAETMWTDETLLMWIEGASSDGPVPGPVDAVVYQEPAGNAARRNLELALDQNFALKARLPYKGWAIRLYHRDPHEPR